MCLLIFLINVSLKPFPSAPTSATAQAKFQGLPVQNSHLLPQKSVGSNTLPTFFHLGAAFWELHFFPSHSPTQHFLCPFSVVLPMLVHFSHGSRPFQLSQPTYSSKSKATKPQKNTGVWKRKPLLKQFVSQSFQSHLISGAFDTSLSSAEGAKCVRREREKKEQKNNLL